MDALETSLIIIVAINLMLVLGQFSAVHVNPDFQGSLVDCQNSPLGKFGNCTTGNSYSFDASKTDFIPTSSTSVDSTTGSVFTDLWNTVKGFFLDTLGLKYVVAIVSAPASFMKGVGLDPDFASLIGGMWWIINAILVISYIKR
jgi:hypothetical protein